MNKLILFKQQVAIVMFFYGQIFSTFWKKKIKGLPNFYYQTFICRFMVSSDEGIAKPMQTRSLSACSARASGAPQPMHVGDKNIGTFMDPPVHFQGSKVSTSW